jgi:hypothetical protein
MRYIDSNPETYIVEPVASISEVEVGSVVEFIYDGKQKHAIVLNPEWNGKLHALRLRNIATQTLQQLLRLIGDNNDEKKILAEYKESRYVKDRPYRTYTIDKISNIRKVYLTLPPVKPKPTPKVKKEEKKEEIKKYKMYEE